MVLLFRKKDFTIPASGLNSVESVSLGGLNQSILIQAVHPEKPDKPHQVLFALSLMNKFASDITAT